MRLLIVEDSDLVRRMTRLAFPAKENDLHDAANGVEAMMHLEIPEIFETSGGPSSLQ